jgi:acyl transferase domain-containing protein/NADPH:quinone reductase-like Zn-dependent oxidoreductase/acyl carrier protein
MSQATTAPLAQLTLLAREAWAVNEVVGADPIAVVGMGCRVAGADSPSELWQLLVSATDAITEVPGSRWSAARYYDPDPATPGRMNSRWGSFLAEVAAFDAAFFGIPAREAAAMDPQHRVVLETACDALDDAGQTAVMLQGSLTGVFLGLYNADYFQALHADRDRITAYATSGTLPAMAAGRLAYHFDLRGPSLVVDTACSSSLVAVHQACASLRARTCDLAVAGGVSLVLGPDRSISLSKWGFMAPDGRCKPFDAAADGWVRGEGCGVVVLRRLSDALAAGDRIHAVIRGSAINQDGRSTVMTAPNGAAQVAVIRAALADARVAAQDVGFVEAHGTGTSVGDPIEFEALDDALGRVGSHPCYLGAVKANLGHLEAAAGVTGLIKTVLALKHEHVPPQIHFTTLNPLLSYEGTRLRVSPDGVAWPASSRRRFAGVSAFGFSGTNAHVVLEEAPVLPEPPAERATAHLLLLSGKSPKSLETAARAFVRGLASGGPLSAQRLTDVCFTAGVRRQHHEYRVAVTGATHAEIVARLDHLLEGRPDWAAARGEVAGATDVVLAFSGSTPAPPEVGRLIRAREPLAQRAFDDCRATLARIGGHTLTDHDGLASAGLPHESAQAVELLALQLTLAAVWRAWGLQPSTAVGHGVGELAAAHVRGDMTLEDALRAAIARPAVASSNEGLEALGASAAELIAAGQRRFVEIGPHPELGTRFATAGGGADAVQFVSSLHRDRDGITCLLAAAGALHVSGVALDVNAVLPRGRLIDLPAYAWDRKQYWALECDAVHGVEAREAAIDGRDLLDSELDTPWTGRRVFEATLSDRRPSWAPHHRVGGRALFPAAAFLTMAASAAARVHDRQVELEDVVIGEPLELRSSATRVQVGIDRRGDGGTFEIVSRGAGSEPRSSHVSGGYRARPEIPENVPSSRSSMRPAVMHDPGRFYAGLAEQQTEFGEPFRRVVQVGRLDGGAVGTVDGSLPGAGTWPHPLVFDACLQVAWAAITGARSTMVPVGFGRVCCRAATNGPLTVEARAAAAGDGETWVVDLEALDASGQQILMVERVVFRPLAAADVDEHASELQPCRLEWSRAPETARARALPLSWLVLADRGRLARQVEARLLSEGRRCLIVPFEDTARSLGEIAKAFVRDTPEPRGLLNLCPEDVQVPAPTDDLPDEALRRVCGSTLDLVQCAGQLPGAFAELALVTRGAQAVDATSEPNPIQALAWGMARALDLEYPELPCRRIDLGAAGRDDAAVIVAGLALDGRELARRQGGWWAPRLVTASPPLPGDARLVLEVGQRGSLEHLTLAQRPRGAPPAGRLELRVLAAGLNFRDVLNVLGMYPGEAGALGNECVGVVTAVGPGVDGVAPGDVVVALGTECLATYVTVDANTAVPLPDGLDPVEAATVPITFLTADYALRDCAAMRPGDRVLVHAGAGGVGIAAIQIALRAGARVYATAGSDEKRQYLRALGVLHVADSRSLAFADDLRRVTGGEGVDIVLNSLAGEFIPRSLDLLAPNGRFVEIGKTDVWDARTVGQRRPDVSYAVLFLGDLIRQAPTAVADRLRQLLDACARGDLQPLPRRTFALDRAAGAFRFMARARHIGKVVLVTTPDVPWRVRPEGSYLVAGGTGAMGMHAARWLIGRGATHVVLASRTGRGATETDLSALRSHATVALEQCDLTSWRDVDRVMARFGSDWPPLRGVIHAAGTLHDGVLAGHTWPSFREGLEVKVRGAWHLHRATQRAALDAFVSYSSLAAVLGSAGQASYCAANAFLDALTSLRTTDGLRATSVAWGSWADGGMSARLTTRERGRWEADGVLPLSPHDGDAALDRLRATGETALVVARVDWRRYLQRHSVRTALVEAIAAPRAVEEGAPRPTPPQNVVAELRRVHPVARHPAMVQMLRERVRALVGLPADSRVDEQRGFRDLGLDSLLAVELRNGLQHELGRALPATLAFEYPTLATLSTHLLRELDLDAAETAEPGVVASAPLHDLSDEEAEAMLERELEALSRRLGVES